jgi:hypothetical protein
MRILKFSFIATFLLIAGATGGFVAAIVYGLANIESVATSELILAVLLAPLFQALVVLLYGLLGYPVYVYLAKRGKLSLSDPFRNDVGK